MLRSRPVFCETSSIRSFPYPCFLKSRLSQLVCGYVRRLKVSAVAALRYVLDPVRAGFQRSGEFWCGGDQAGVGFVGAGCTITGCDELRVSPSSLIVRAAHNMR